MKIFVCFFLWSLFLWSSSPPVMAIDTLSSSVGEESKNGPDAEILTAIAKD